MKWSFSKARMFEQCPRKWYYSEIMASPAKKKPERRKIHLLKQIKSVYAWRGSLVDTVIEKLIVPRMDANLLPTEDEVIEYSMELMDRQLEFAIEKKYRSLDITKSDTDNAYCALYDIEYNGSLDEDLLSNTKKDVIQALQNLMRSDFLKEIMEKSERVIAQRSLSFPFENASIVGTPDLLVFFPDSPPLITDWKVQISTSTNAWRQLGIYAIILSRTKPHSDFPKNSEPQLKDPNTFRLVEHQLLRNTQIEHSIFSKDIVEIEDYIFNSCTRINSLVQGKDYRTLNIDRFPTTRFPFTCERCQFRKFCWRKNWYDPY